MRYIKKINRKYWRLKFQFWEWFKNSIIYSNFTLNHFFHYLYNYIYLSPFVQTLINYPRYTLRYNTTFIKICKLIKSDWALRWMHSYLFVLFFILFLYLFYLSYVKIIILYILFCIYSYIIWTSHSVKLISQYGTNRFNFFASKRRLRRQSFLLNSSIRKKFILRKLKGHFYRIELLTNHKRHNWHLCQANFKEYIFNHTECQLFNNHYHHISYYYFDKPLDSRSNTLFEQNLLKNYITSHKCLINIIKTKLIMENFVEPHLVEPKATIVIKQIYAKYYVYDYEINTIILLSCFAICWQDSKQCIPIIPLGPWCPYKIRKKSFFEILPWSIYEEAWLSPVNRVYIPGWLFLWRNKKVVISKLILSFYNDCIKFYDFLLRFLSKWKFYIILLVKLSYWDFVPIVLWLRWKIRWFNANLYYYYYYPARYLYRSIWHKSLKKRKIPWFRPRPNTTLPHPFIKSSFKRFLHFFRNFFIAISREILIEIITILYALFLRQKLLRKFLLWILRKIPWPKEPTEKELWQYEQEHQLRLRETRKGFLLVKYKIHEFKKEYLGSLREENLSREILHDREEKILRLLSSWRIQLQFRIENSIWSSYKFSHYFYLLLKEIIRIIPKIIYHMFYQTKSFAFQLFTLNTKKNNFHKYLPDNLDYWKCYIIRLHLRALNIFYKLYSKEQMPTFFVEHYNILSRHITNPITKLFPNYNFTEILQDDILRLLRVDTVKTYYQPFWLDEQFDAKKYFALLNKVHKLSLFSLDKKFILVYDFLHEYDVKLLSALPNQLDLLPNNYIFAQFSEFFHEDISSRFYYKIWKNKLMYTSELVIPYLSDTFSIKPNPPFILFTNFPLISQNQINFSIALPYSVWAKTTLYKHNGNTNFIELMCKDLRTNDILWKNFVSNRILGELEYTINLLKLNIKDSCQNIYNLFNKNCNKAKIIIGSHKKGNFSKNKNIKKQFIGKTPYNKFLKLFEQSCDYLLISTFEISCLNLYKR